MSITTVSSREFNQDVGKAKRATSNGPVYITDRGHLSHVLLSIGEYQKITNKGKTVVQLLSMSGADNVEFDAPPLKEILYNPVEFD